MERCSFWRFIWGRIITKYSTTNISTSGSMLINEDCMSPPAAVWAKAEEMNTVAPEIDGLERLRPRTSWHDNVPQGESAPLYAPPHDVITCNPPSRPRETGNKPQATRRSDPGCGHWLISRS